MNSKTKHLLSLVLAIQWLIAPAYHAHSAIITVPTDYPKVDAAVYVAQPNDTVRILPGTYLGRLGTISKNLTIQSLFATSGDSTYIGSTVIDGSLSYGEIVRCTGPGTTVLLEGLTLRNGRGDFANPSIGGGVYVDSSSVIIRHCAIDSCRAYRGAGIVAFNATVRVDSSTIQHGLTEYCVGGYCGMSDGAGIFGFKSNITLTASTVSGNYARDGSGIFADSSALTLERCRIVSNSADGGGAGLRATYSDVTIDRCEFSRNTSQGQGFTSGGVLSHTGGRCEITQATVTANNCWFDPVLDFYITDVVLQKSIVWGNVPKPENSGINPISFGGSGATFSAEYCDIDGDDSLGTGCFNLDPMFCDSALSDYHINAQSPCAPGNNMSGSLIGALPVACWSGNCCQASTGNIDCDPSDGVDIGDLTALIDNLFISFTPLCCEAEANCDGTGGVDIGDVTALIDNLFITFTPLAGCQ